MHRIMAEWSIDQLAVLARQAMGAVLNRLLVEVGEDGILVLGLALL